MRPHPRVEGDALKRVSFQALPLSKGCWTDWDCVLGLTSRQEVMECIWLELRAQPGTSQLRVYMHVCVCACVCVYVCVCVCACACARVQ